jgi:hypothetical protein
MQNTFKRFSVIAGFAVLLAVLVGNGFLTRRQVGKRSLPRGAWRIRAA